MKQITNFIIEKLRINKDIKLSNDNEELEDLLKHFEFDKLYEIDKGRLMKQPYITKEEGEEIKQKLLDFILDNNVQKENFKYYTNRGRKFSNKKIDKDYTKDNSKLINLDKFRDEDTLFKGDNGLKFEGNSETKVIAMSGPFGGMKICCYK